MLKKINIVIKIKHPKIQANKFSIRKIIYGVGLHWFKFSSNKPQVHCILSAVGIFFIHEIGAVQYFLWMSWDSIIIFFAIIVLIFSLFLGFFFVFNPKLRKLILKYESQLKSEQKKPMIIKENTNTLMSFPHLIHLPMWWWRKMRML